MVKRRYADFKRGRTDTNDTERSGRPNSAVVQENTKKLHKLKLREIAEELKISECNVFTIFHEHFSMRKLGSKWMPHLLIVDQKQQRVDDSECCLQLFQRNKKKFSRKYVTMDETWIHHFTLESNWLSAEWTAAGESHPKRPKTQTSIALLVRLKEEIAKNKSQMQKKKVLFHQDNALYHEPIATIAKLHELQFELLLHSPYSPDLTPATIGCLQTSNEWKYIKGNIFSSNEESIPETEAYFEA